MKNKIKTILTATVVSAISLGAIGCSSNDTKLAKDIDKSMANFVSSINKLDYVETAKAAPASPNKYGKIVETAATPQTETEDEKNSSETKNSNLNKIKILNNKNGSVQFLNNKIEEVEIENTITRPAQRTDNFKLFVLSDSPFITFTSDDNSAALNMNIKFSTEKIENTSTEIESKINELILKRSILMIYVNEIYNGNVNFSDDNKVAINAYVNVIKENTSYLNGNRGMVKNQLGLASNLASSETNENLINYYIIKSGEALENRASKLDSAISAIDSIIKIIESSLSENSTYFKSNLSAAYDNVISSINGSNAYNAEIKKDSTNKDIADSISNSLNFGHKKINEENQNNLETQNQNNNVTIYKNENLINKETQPAPLSISQTQREIGNQQTLNNSNTNLNEQNSQNTNSIKPNSYQYNRFQNSNGNNINQKVQNNNQQTENYSNSIYYNRNQGYKMPTLRLNKNISSPNRFVSHQNTNNLKASTNNENPNSSKEVNNMNSENEKIMRADRTSERQKQEEYTSSNSRMSTMEERASTMPHTMNLHK